MKTTKTQKTESQKGTTMRDWDSEPIRTAKDAAQFSRDMFSIGWSTDMVEEEIKAAGEAAGWSDDEKAKAYSYIDGGKALLVLRREKMEKRNGEIARAAYRRTKGRGRQACGHGYALLTPRQAEKARAGGVEVGEDRRVSLCEFATWSPEAQAGVKVIRVAQIFSDVDGWHIDDADGDVLDARGTAYATRDQAIASLKAGAKYARRIGGVEGCRPFTHYLTPSGKVIAL